LILDPGVMAASTLARIRGPGGFPCSRLGCERWRALPPPRLRCWRLDVAALLRWRPPTHRPATTPPPSRWSTSRRTCGWRWSSGGCA